MVAQLKDHPKCDKCSIPMINMHYTDRNGKDTYQCKKCGAIKKV